jgi:hypothetical protein
VITWLGSVTRLKHPAPSLGQHVSSLTPAVRSASPAYWGTSKLVEAVVCPADPDGLTGSAWPPDSVCG